MYVGEGETAGKVEGILHLFQNEEKGKSATSNVKYYFSTLLFTFLLHATINHRASILFRFFNYLFIYFNVIVI